MESLNIKYKNFYKDLTKDDAEALDIIDTVEKYQVDFSLTSEILAASESIEENEVIYGYSN